MRTVFTLFALLICSQLCAQDFAWASQLASAGNTKAQDMAVDAAGNTYTVGFFSGTVDLDPGPDTLNFTSAGIFDVFVVKLNSQGGLEWARQIGDYSYDEGYGIDVDATGNVFVGGLFAKTVDFDPSPGVFNLTAVSNFASFILKLDNDGNFLWAKAFDGSGTNGADALVVDASGNVLLTGDYQGSPDFDPGPGTWFEPSGGTDVFVVKLDPSGNFLWVATSSGNNNEYGMGLTTDGQNNVYVVGRFGGATDFDPGPNTAQFTPPNGLDAFVWKLNSNGGYEWFVHYDSGATGWSDSSHDAVVWDDTYVYVTGMLDQKLFISRLSTQSGNTNWTANYSGPESVGWSIATDADGDVYSCGEFGGLVDFDPGPGTANMSAQMFDHGAFVHKLDSAGTFVFAKEFDGSNSEAIAKGIGLDGSEHIYTAGYFEGTIDFDPGSGLYNLTHAGGSPTTSPFVHKLALPCAQPPATQLATSSCNITLSSINQYLFVDPVANATSYEYHVTDGGGFDEIAYSHQGYPGSTFFSMSWVPNITHNTTYTVEVRARVNGCWGPYGTACTIATPSNIPTTSLSSSWCNTTLSYLYEYFYINSVPAAHRYEYEISDGAGFIDTVATLNAYPTATWFSFLFVPGIVHGTTYTIRVRAQVGGVWAPFGLACTLATPALPSPVVQPGYCNSTLSSLGQFFYITAVPGAQRYQYYISDGAGFDAYPFSYWASPTATWVSFNLVPGIQHGTTYNVSVRAKVGGVWGTFGPACPISTPTLKNDFPESVPIATEATASSLHLWPNPGSDLVTLQYDGAAEPSTIRLIAATGQVVDELRAPALGPVLIAVSSYPAGLYLVQVQTASGLQTRQLVIQH